MDPEDLKAWIDDQLMKRLDGKPITAAAVRAALIDMLEPMKPHLAIETDPGAMGDAQLIFTVLAGATLQDLIRPN